MRLAAAAGLEARTPPPGRLVQSKLGAHNGGMVMVTVKGKRVEMLAKPKKKKERKPRKEKPRDGDQPTKEGTKSEFFERRKTDRK